MPSATRVIVLKRRVWVALRPGFVAAAMLLALAPQGASAAPLDLFSISPAAPFTSEQVDVRLHLQQRHRIADMGPRWRPVLRRRHGPDGPMVLLAGRRIRGHALHQRGVQQRHLHAEVHGAEPAAGSGHHLCAALTEERRQRLAGLDVCRPRRAARVSGVGPRRRWGVRRLVGADRLGHLLGCGEPPDRAAGYGPRRSRERNRGHDRGAGTAGARTESLPRRADRGELRHPWDQDRAARDHRAETGRASRSSAEAVAVRSRSWSARRGRRLCAYVASRGGSCAPARSCRCGSPGQARSASTRGCGSGRGCGRPAWTAA